MTSTFLLMYNVSYGKKKKKKIKSTSDFKLSHFLIFYLKLKKC